MKLFRLGILIIVCMGLLSCASIPLEVSHIPSIDLKGWKVGYAYDDPGKGNIVEWVRKNESINNWSRLITVQFFEGHREAPSAFMARLKKSLTLKCPNIEWRVLERTETSILFEWKIHDCKGQSDQHEIAKLMKGNDGLHRAAYVEKTVSMGSVVRNRWIEWLSEAYLKKEGRRVVVRQ